MGHGVASLRASTYQRRPRGSRDHLGSAVRRRDQRCIGHPLPQASETPSSKGLSLEARSVRDSAGGASSARWASSSKTVSGAARACSAVVSLVDGMGTSLRPEPGSTIFRRSARRCAPRRLWSPSLRGGYRQRCTWRTRRGTLAEESTPPRFCTRPWLPGRRSSVDGRLTTDDRCRGPWMVDADSQSIVPGGRDLGLRPAPCPLGARPSTGP